MSDKIIENNQVTVIGTVVSDTATKYSARDFL